MSRKGIVAIVLIVAPALLAFFEAASFASANRNNGSLISSGVRRSYLLHVPRNYDPSKPTPLVISLHGAGGWPAQQMRVSEWNALADRERIIVAYPSGLSGAGPRIWNVRPGDGLTRDVRFIADLIDHLQATYNIDRNRIYANGLSNGAGMSFVLSCTLSDRIAAVGAVAAAQTLPWRWCTDDRPVPMIAFHGTADPVTPYNGGVTWISTRSFPSVPVWIANWARRNRCSADPIEQNVTSDVSRREYANCANNADVVLYIVKEGGHSWPGGGPLPEFLVGRTTQTVNATNEMWAFFRAHPRVTARD
jgi:polyhydroxybutyrate depolymerase